MKYSRVIAGLEERRKEYDAIRDPKYKAATRRPGSLNAAKTGGPSKSKSNRKRR